MFRAGKSPEQIAEERQLKVNTILGHLFSAVIAGEPVDLNRLMTADEQQQAADAFSKLGFDNLTDVFELLDERIDYATLRIFRTIKQKHVSSTEKVH